MGGAGDVGERRKKDRQTDTQTYRHTDIQTHRHTDIQKNRSKKERKERKIGRLTASQPDRQFVCWLVA